MSRPNPILHPEQPAIDDGVAPPSRRFAIFRAPASPLRPETLPLLLGFAAVLAIAAFGTEAVPASVAAILVSGLCLALPPVFGSAIIIVGANDPHLFRDPAISSASAIDVAIVATTIRAAMAAHRRRPSLLELFALAFLISAAAATAFADTSTAATAFVRIAAYLILGVVVGRALTPGDRPRLARAFIGGAIGQAIAALAGLTPTMSTGFPIGRYLGTLGDPAQFGIPIAFACVLVTMSGHFVHSSRVRYMSTVLLAAAVIGSVTLSAWATLGTGLVFAALARAWRERGRGTRVAVSISAVAAASLGTALVIFGAGTFGFRHESATIRRASIDAASRYFAEHPLRPTGLGSRAVAAREPVTQANPIFASTFEKDVSGWLPYGDAHLTRQKSTSRSYVTTLHVMTRGRKSEEGTQLSMIGGIAPDSPYTLSLDAKIPRTVRVWLYVDEYDFLNRWLGYRYGIARGMSAWHRYSWTFSTIHKTAHLRLYVLTGSRVATSFAIDNVRFEAGRTRGPSPSKAKAPPIVLQITAIYNTWLAVAVELGLLAAVFLFALAVGTPYHAFKLGDRAAAFALAALLVPSVTENFVYGASLVTLTWFLALGLTATASERAGTDRKSGRTGPRIQSTTLRRAGSIGD